MGGFLGRRQGPDRLERVAQMLANGCCAVEVLGDEAVEPNDVQRVAAEFLEFRRRAALDGSGPRRTSLLDFLGQATIIGIGIMIIVMFSIFTALALHSAFLEQAKP